VKAASPGRLALSNETEISAGHFHTSMMAQRTKLLQKND
jgi:hypothetical protein